jgi:5-methylcytosine-specific restriction endonuclease McrA
MRTKKELTEEERESRRAYARKKSAEYRKLHPEKIKDYNKRYYDENREKEVARVRAKREANPEKAREETRLSVARWRAANPERSRESVREWQSKNPEKVRELARASSKRRRSANPEIFKQKGREYARKKRASLSEPELEILREKNRQYLRNHPEKAVAYTKRRRAAKKGAFIGPMWTLLELAQRDSWRCHICGLQVTRSDWSEDHLIPLSKGGPHTFTNVALAHRVCNSKRGTGRLPAQLRLL